MNFIFFYTEVSGYFLSCAAHLARVSGGEVHVIRWRINIEAPFHFPEYPGVYIYNRSDFNAASLLQFCLKKQTGFLYVAGRLDKDYLSVAGKMKKTGAIILIMFRDRNVNYF